MICGEVRSPVYEAVHTRRIFFVAGEYWLIIDSLSGSVPHKYDLRFHLTAEALNHCTRIDGGIRTTRYGPSIEQTVGVALRGHPFLNHRAFPKDGWPRRATPTVAL
jgi:hypothetical protein